MRRRKGKAIDRGHDSHESSSESDGVAAESSGDESSDSGETLTKEEARARRKELNAILSTKGSGRFDQDWEDTYLADELRMREAGKIDNEGDGLPNDWILCIFIVFFAAAMGGLAHFLLARYGYHDLGHEDIRVEEL